MSNIQKREITKELQESYLDYAMSVIISRALPDVRDGLKPVQRRILWAMWESGLDHSSKFRKSANVVGEVMAKYHPHGDMAIYDTMVRLAQDFSLRYPLINGQGNFGSIDGDSAAAHRYTEARLQRISDEMLMDIEKETVDWAPNYDASKQEPRVLPAKLPNLLLNGTLGIAVGMATSIPPHNLGEVADAILYLADHGDATTEDLLKFVKGPDFPTGGVIFDEKAIRAAYVSGRGGIITRAKATVEERKKDQYDIVVTEIPYMVNKSEMVKQIAELVTDKKIEGIRDLRDESDREGLRVVIELKNDASPQKVLNQLYKHTNLQKDFHLNMVALVNGIEPRTLSLGEVLVEYLAYRKIVVRRRTEFDLKKAQERAHILEGFHKALGSIDRVIKVIKASKDRDDARVRLKKIFGFSELQANAILEMRLQTLAALERQKIEDELKEKMALIKGLQLILKSPARMLEIIKKEVRELKEKYGDKRRTEVVPTGLTVLTDEDLAPKEEAMITLSSGGYIKRLPPDTFSSQKRGGKGLIGSDVSEEDFLTQFVSANTHDQILFFTDRGRVFQTRVYEIPAASRVSKGRAVHNFLEMPAEEKVSAIVTYSEKSTDAKYLALLTQNGLIKKTPLEDFKNIRRTGIIAMSLKKGDALKWARLTAGSDQFMLTTEGGQSIRFSESQARSMGRTAAGVRGIKLKKDDKVAGFDIIKKGVDAKKTQVLVLMTNGFGKQTSLSEYKVQNRGGSGIKTANVTVKTGKLIASRVVGEEEELFALSAKGQVIRTELLSVRRTGRAAQGVRVMNLKPGDKLAAIAIL
ncbi:MAG: DNA gyrase subunit A [Candidatus Liptonbacteria bacterium]|nr:DNA gyrase subunit A [Candidatus Liptonbacteria bacterium]